MILYLDTSSLGFDALHLASFLEILAQAEGEEVEFSAFDVRLTAAAAAERAGQTTAP